MSDREAGARRDEPGRYLWPAAVALVVAAFCWPVLLGGRVWFVQACGDADLSDFYHPMRALLARSLARGTLPFWTPDLYGGLPAFSEIEIGALHPLNWLGPWSHPGRALSITIALTLVLAGLGAFRLARVSGLSPQASFVAGVTWSLSGQMMQNIVTPNGLLSVMPLPLVLSFAEESWRSGAPRRIVWATPALALSLFGGYPIMTYLIGWALMIQTAVATLLPPDPQTGPGRSHVGWLAAAVLLSALLMAPQLLPTVEYLSQSDRATPLSGQVSATCSLHPVWLLQWLHPWILGDVSRLGTPFPEDGYFPWTHAGFLAVAALALALARCRRDRFAARHLVIVVVTAIVAMGRYTPVFPLLLRLPGASYFRNPSRALFLTELAMALLVGWLLDGLFRSGAASRRALAAGLAAIQIVGLALVALPILPTVEAGLFPPPSETAEFVSRARGARVMALDRVETWAHAYVAAGGWRGDQTPYLRYLSLLHPNASLLYGIPSVQAYVGLNLARSELVTSNLWLRKADGTHPVTRVVPEFVRAARLLGARYVLSPRRLEGRGIARVHATAFPWNEFQIHVHEVEGTLPRARLVGAALASAGTRSDLSRLLGPSWRPTATTIVEDAGPAGQTPWPSSPGPAGEAAVVAQDDRVVVVDVSAHKPGLLVLADTYYPGWRAFVDGTEVPIVRADLVWRAVRLEAGRHRVAMVYTCPMFDRGVVVLVFGAVVWLVLAWPARRSPVRHRGACRQAAPDQTG